MELCWIKEIKQYDKYHFSIAWGDGTCSFYHLAQLQKNCPCRSCRDEKTGCFIKDPELISERLTAKAIVSVGNYALRIEFESGCQNGIYTFSFLRQLSELEQKGKK